MRRCLTLLVALAAASVLPAAGQDGQPGGVAVTPALVERDLPGRAVELAFTVSNTQAAPVRVHLRVAALGQEENGTLRYGDDLAGLTVTPTELSLEPGAQAPVRVSGAVPAGQAGLYGALLATPTAQTAAASAAATGVEVRTRVAAPLLLRGPRPWRESLEIGDITLRPTDQERVYRVGALLRNTGDVHQRPRGEVRISRPGGPVLGTATLSGGVILPGAGRRLDGGQWTAPLPPGTTVRLDVEAGPPRTTASRELRLPPPLGADRDGAVGPAAPVAADELPGLGGGEAPAPPRWLVPFAIGLLLVMAALLVDRLRRRDAVPGAPAR